MDKHQDIKKKTGEERLYEISRKGNVAKAVIVDQNRVYTYGYAPRCQAKPE